MVRLLIVTMVLLLPLPSLAMAQGPLQTVREPLEAGIQLLRDPAYASPDKRTEQRDRIWETIRGVFDLRVVSALAVGKAWRGFTKAQRAEFTDLFSQLLGNTYVSRIQGNYNDETVEFAGEKLLPKKRALVKSFIVRGEQRIAVDFALRQKKNVWKVYDIKVEGVSLVLNYRNQFTAFLSKPNATVAQLIERVRKQLAKMGAEAVKEKTSS